MKIRTLGNQMTFYDDEGNIIKEVPERPPEPPEDQVRMINIVEFEDRLMGIDPNAKPDFFDDYDNDERFRDVDEIPELNENFKAFDLDDIMKGVVFATVFVIMFAVGYIAS